MKYGVWVGIIALAIAACEPGDGRGADGGTAGAADPCDVDVAVLLSCTDETCDLQAYDAELAACSVDDKADGIGDTLRGWMVRLQEKLASKAASCFEDEDTGCLERVYWALAAGARVKGMPNAANMMWNFLGCDDDPAEVDPDVVSVDDNVIAAMEVLRADAWAEAELAVDQGAQTLSVDLGPESVAAESADIWYAMGNFHIVATAAVTIEAGAVKSVTIDYRANDRYDWHPGMEAGGEAEGVSAFKDDWAQFLVDEEVACEFDMVSEWSETLTEDPGDASEGDSTDPREPGECCEQHNGSGCGVEACELSVCEIDPQCCAGSWSGICVARAAEFVECGCSDSDSD